MIKINPNHRIKRIVLYIVSLLLHPFLRVKKGRVLFISYDGAQYSCNPRFITEYILDNNIDFELIWLYTKQNHYKNIDKRIKVVGYPSLSSVIAINTAQFVITNKRTAPWVFGWIKKKGQKYIMTWHGGKPLKRVELDAIDTLGARYYRKIKQDSAYCDLMLSESRYTSKLYRSSFLYDGEILEKGAPRNDIFFKKDIFEITKKSVFEYFGFSSDDHVVLYAPTFRGNMTLDCYSIDWNRIIPALESMIGGRVKVLLRLHPNFIQSGIDCSSLFCGDNIYEATSYKDINELLIASETLISDYSSCMFDYAFTQRPCFIFAADSDLYERGFYLNIHELPFPFAENNDELLFNIENFDKFKYKEKLGLYMNNSFGIFDKGHASQEVVNWMIQQSNLEIS